MLAWMRDNIGSAFSASSQPSPAAQSSFLSRYNARQGDLQIAVAMRDNGMVDPSHICAEAPCESFAMLIFRAWSGIVGAGRLFYLGSEVFPPRLCSLCAQSLQQLLIG